MCLRVLHACPFTDLLQAQESCMTHLGRGKSLKVNNMDVSKYFPIAVQFSRFPQEAVYGSQPNMKVELHAF